jgi:hypothetical protein
VTPRASTAARVDPPRAARRAPYAEPRRAPAPRPTVVAPAAQPLATRTRWRPRPFAVALSLVVASLLLVVGGNMELASGQLRLEQVDSQLAQLQSTYAAALESVAAATSPQALAGVGGLRTSSRENLSIPSVSLRHRLGPPALSSAACCTGR